MSIQKPRRIDRRTAERLLDAAPTGAHEGHPPLAALLAAASAPGRPDELAREHAALAAFRSAQLTPVPRPRALSTLKSAASRVLTVQVAAVVAATTFGGVALAASTGKLPNPLVQHRPTATSGLSAAPPTATPSPDVDDATAVPGVPSDANSPAGSPAPSPSLARLCQAYIGAKKNREEADNSAGGKLKLSRSATPKPTPASSRTAKPGSGVPNLDSMLEKLLDNPAFRSLVSAAGGKDKVEGYCLTPTPTPSSATPRSTKPANNQRGGNSDDKPGQSR